MPLWNLTKWLRANWMDQSRRETNRTGAERRHGRFICASVKSTSFPEKKKREGGE